MLQYGIRHVVLSPGSRNAPLIHTFTQHPGFTCYTVVDERSAAFFALGLSQKLHQPVATCCTSGTALLNYGPAIAEAFYQEIPLLVISADRPEAWIGQGDGQTIPQNGAFTAITKKSVQLPEPANDTDEWYCNRLVNEALIQLTANGNGPVHINVPLSEPLYQFTTSTLPETRKITLHTAKGEVETEPFQSVWNASSKRMVPLQVFNSLSNDKTALETIKNGIIGGAAIDPELEKEVAALPNGWYSTYGMCKENKMPIYVFDMDTVGNLKKVMSGEKIGTLVKL